MCGGQGVGKVPVVFNTNRIGGVLPETPLLVEFTWETGTRGGNLQSTVYAALSVQN